MTTYAYLPTPLGDLLAIADGSGLSGLYFPDHRRGRAAESGWEHEPEAFGTVRAQLARYFDGDLRAFDLPLDLQGTPFQLRVWERLRAVPHGKTTTYRALAEDIGRRTAVRAVAGAVARNPVSIVVPCHRVVGSDGSLTGYAGGPERKRRLLDLERALLPS